MVLLLIVTTPLFFSAFFLVKKNIIQWEMEEKLEAASLQTITVSVSDFVWLKKGKEILVNGRMFDVKKSTVSSSGNHIIFTGLYDEDEQKLHKSLEDFIQNKNKLPAQQDEILAKFFSMAVAVPENSQYSFSGCENRLLMYPFFTDEIIESAGFPIYQPPRM